jgi:hypothetical protein
MVELQEAALDTAAAVVRNEGALAAVTCPYLSPDLCRNVARAWVCTTAAARAVGGGDLLLLQLLDQHFQSLGYHFSSIAVGNLMPQQVLGPLQQVVRLLGGGELDL